MVRISSPHPRNPNVYALALPDLQLKLLRCLHRIFMEPIRCDLNFHYNAMRHRLKERSTLNPNYPSGTCRLPLFWRY